MGRPLGAAGFFVSGGLGGSEDMLKENRLLMWTKREKACLIWISSTNTYKENTCYISFRFTECVSRGVRKVTVLGRKGRFWAQKMGGALFFGIGRGMSGSRLATDENFFPAENCHSAEGPFWRRVGFFFWRVNRQKCARPYFRPARPPRRWMGKMRLCEGKN